MLLIHKPLSISSPTPAHYHRRLPSARHVSVQPTRTPGLLSIIPKQQPQRSPQPQRSQQRTTPLKENQRQNRSQKPVNAKAQPVDIKEAIKPTVAEPKSFKAQSKNPSSTPDKSSSGRANQKRSPKDKATAERSSSLTPAKQSRRPARQPSPPALPAQVEVTSHTVSEPLKNPSSNFFDPFLSTSSDSDLSDTKSKSTFKSLPPPKLGRPSGKLAKRRQQSVDATQTPTKAIPVPRSTKGRTPGVVNVSRSAPVNNVSKKAKSTVLRARPEDVFPICDDMTDLDGEGSRPSTPVQKDPTRQQQSIFFDDGPRTAPLSSTTPNFPFALSTPSPAIRKHHRAPSDGVFNMSLDEDSSSDASEGLRNLFGDLLAHKRRPDGQKAGYFASSQFQNSPSPEDLPAPDFIH